MGMSWYENRFVRGLVGMGKSGYGVRINCYLGDLMRGPIDI